MNISKNVNNRKVFSKKASKIDNLCPQFDTYLVNVKLMVKNWSNFVTFLENMNFIISFQFNDILLGSPCHSLPFGVFSTTWYSMFAFFIIWWPEGNNSPDNKEGKVWIPSRTENTKRQVVTRAAQRNIVELKGNYSY